MRQGKKGRKLIVNRNRAKMNPYFGVKSRQSERVD